MKRLAYARVSTSSQHLDRQLDALERYGYDDLFTEKMTGTKASRPALDNLRMVAREGDVIIIESLSRLGRSSKDLLNLLDEFERKGVQVVSLKESLDSHTATGKLITTVLLALCQFEADLTRQRTNEGLTAARARGRVGGRPPADRKAVEKALKLHRAQTHSIKEIVAICGISQATLYRELAKAAA